MPEQFEEDYGFLRSWHQATCKPSRPSQTSLLCLLLSALIRCIYEQTVQHSPGASWGVMQYDDLMFALFFWMIYVILHFLCLFILSSSTCPSLADDIRGSILSYSISSVNTTNRTNSSLQSYNPWATIELFFILRSFFTRTMPRKYYAVYTGHVDTPTIYPSW